jgi:MYXO-CTERM domain-containing protein
LPFSVETTVMAPVPEPGTWAAAALLAGVAGFIHWRRRRVAA